MNSLPVVFQGSGAVLGFDAREAWLDAQSLWTCERQRDFLLTIPGKKPLSADTSVWPTIFSTGEGFALCDVDQELNGWRGLELPPWIGANWPLWSDLLNLEQYVKGSWPFPAKPVSLVAVTCPDGSVFRDGEWPYLQETSPREVDGIWTLLGFDVLANQSTLSGLMNCGYSNAKHQYAKTEWAPRLQPNHLFGTTTDAVSFCEWRNMSVPEHAPFFVAGLYLVREIGGVFGNQT
jgi:hypothetical protein